MSKIRAAKRRDDPVTAEVLERAIERGKNRKPSGVQAISVRHVPSLKSLLLTFADQSAVSLPVQKYPELADLGPADLKALTVGFGGSALCLDKRDLHISIAGLIAASPSLMAMATTVVAARHGRSNSEAKRIAARENGKKGGRPRKHPLHASTG
ncbi:MAG TPA: DUF2442 domain-containing protein [Rhodanobacteraceae bacterium]|nr:DUF2442 domain-containing protein [Rhodanobacteraceae bacterium]